MKTRLNFLRKHTVLTMLFGALFLLAAGATTTNAQWHSRGQERRAVNQHQRQERRQFRYQERYERRGYNNRYYNNNGYYNGGGYYGNGRYNNPYYNRYPTNGGYYGSGGYYSAPHRYNRNGFRRGLRHLFGGR